MSFGTLSLEVSHAYRSHCTYILSAWAVGGTVNHIVSSAGTFVEHNPYYNMGLMWSFCTNDLKLVGHWTHYYLGPILVVMGHVQKEVINEDIITQFCPHLPKLADCCALNLLRQWCQACCTFNLHSTYILHKVFIGVDTKQLVIVSVLVMMLLAHGCQPPLNMAKEAHSSVSNTLALAS